MSIETQEQKEARWEAGRARCKQLVGKVYNNTATPEEVAEFTELVKAITEEENDRFGFKRRH